MNDPFGAFCRHTHVVLAGAAIARCRAAALHRLMRALVTLEILRERADGTFELMPMGALLRSDADYSLRA
jgi:hypothetical protein